MTELNFVISGENIICAYTILGNVLPLFCSISNNY